MMDILGLSREEIKGMTAIERAEAKRYCWATYTVRRIDLPFRDMKKSGMPITFGVPLEEQYDIDELFPPDLQPPSDLKKPLQDLKNIADKKVL